MGALAGSLASGGGSSLTPSVSPSSGASGTATAGQSLGSSLFNFGGINLGNQDTPLNQIGGTTATNTPATVGNTPLSALSSTPGVIASSYLPLLLIGGLAAILYYHFKH